MKIKGSIAIDGPAGAGKSTVAKMLAKELKILYIDTGAMYRALTFKALKNNLDLEDESKLKELAEKTKIEFKNEDDFQRVICDGVDITEEIRSPEVSTKVSLVAKIPSVRKVLVKKQQEMALSSNVVMDGRDIGTCVLPNASFKFFITASIEERAKRRYAELLSKGYNPKYEDILEDISKRDKIDREREISPLKKAEDAIVIDTSDLSPEEVLAKILTYLER